MRLQAIKINNFRAFFGEHKIEFPHNPKRHINIVLAQNEVGKTTLLSALLFCFYNRLTDSSDKSNILLNREANRAGHTSGFCEIHIIHPNDIDKLNPNVYKIRRNFKGNISEELPNAVIEDGITGEQKNHPDPYGLINSLMPQAISDYFFIDGEGIQNIVGNEVLLREAIKNIQGLTAAEETLEDLEKMLKKKNASLNKLLKNNDEIKKLNKKIEDKNKQIEKINKESKPMLKKLSEVDVKLRGLRQQLKGLNVANIELLVSREEKLKRNIDLYEKKLISLEFDKRKMSGKYSSHIFSQSFIKGLNDFIDEKGAIGELPSGYEEIFVQRLLEKGVCICGKKFSDHSDAYKKIEQLLSDAKTQDFENRMFSIKKRASEFKNKFSEFGPNINSIQEMLADYNDKLKKDSKELKENQEQQRNHDQKKVKKLRDSIDKLEEEQFKLNSKKIKDETTIDFFTKDLKSLNGDRNKLIGSGDGVDAELEELSFLEQSIEYLNNLIKRTEDNGKNEIDELMNSLLSNYGRGTNRFKFKPGTYVPMILDGSDEIESDDPEELEKLQIPLSAGGAAVKRNIFFACSLINQSKRRKNDKEDLIIPGTTAPMIVDAPFSNLDAYNTEMVGNLLFETADQIVIFMSNSAWNGIKEILKKKFKNKVNSVHYISRSYKKSSTPNGNTDPLKIQINDKTNVVSNVYNMETETSNIHKVESWL